MPEDPEVKIARLDERDMALMGRIGQLEGKVDEMSNKIDEAARRHSTLNAKVAAMAAGVALAVTLLTDSDSGSVFSGFLSWGHIVVSAVI